MAEVTIYGTPWCCDCTRAKKFLSDRGVAFREVNIDEKPDAEGLVIRVNNGLRKVPTLSIPIKSPKNLKSRSIHKID